MFMSKCLLLVDESTWPESTWLSLSLVGHSWMWFCQQDRCVSQGDKTYQSGASYGLTYQRATIVLRPLLWCKTLDVSFLPHRPLYFSLWCWWVFKFKSSLPAQLSMALKSQIDSVTLSLGSVQAVFTASTMLVDVPHVDSAMYGTLAPICFVDIRSSFHAKRQDKKCK